MNRSTLRVYLILTMPLIVGKILDLYSTDLGLRLGLHEANPFFHDMMALIGRYNTYALSLFAMAFVGIPLTICWLLSKNIESVSRLKSISKILFISIYTLTLSLNVLAFLNNASLIFGLT